MPAPAPATVPAATPAPARGEIGSGATFALTNGTKVCTSNQPGDKIVATLNESVTGSNGAVIPSGSTVVLDVVREIGSGRLVGPLPKNILVWGVVALVLVLGLRSSGLGRMIYAVGDNPIACRLAGVRVWQVLLAVYVMSGLLAAVGGLLFSGTTGSVGVDQTNAYLLPSVAATVIGSLPA